MNKMGCSHTNGQSNKEQLATNTHDNMDILKNVLSKRSQAEKNKYFNFKKCFASHPPTYALSSVQTWTV